MKKLLFAVATVLSSVYAMAQTTIELNYEKSIEKKGGTWESWPSKWESTQEIYNRTPYLAIREIDEDEGIFSLEFNYRGTGESYRGETVVYDQTETDKIRKNNPSLTAYRYSGTKDYIWTEGATLYELYISSSNWTSSNVKIYKWEYSSENAFVYTAQAPTKPASSQSAKKYMVNFNAHRKQIKGTLADWSSWNAVKNSYFELKVIRERLEFNFKYSENGKLVKNYDITYDDAKTKSLRANNETISCYKINGTKDGWVYLLNTSMTNVLANPDKWSSEKDAVIVFLDEEKTGQRTKIK